MFYAIVFIIFFILSKNIYIISKNKNKYLFIIFSKNKKIIFYYCIAIVMLLSSPS